MTDAELDAAYSLLCRTMTDLGEPNTPLFLARFALLAITEIGDPTTIARMIDDAARDIGTGSTAECHQQDSA